MKKSYTGSAVTPANFLKALAGLNSTKDDDVFVYSPLGGLSFDEQVSMLQQAARGPFRIRFAGADTSAAVEAIGELRADRSEEVLRGVIEADPEERIKRAAEEALEDLQRGGFEGD